jgi:hypothetical protein
MRLPTSLQSLVIQIVAFAVGTIVSREKVHMRLLSQIVFLVLVAMPAEAQRCLKGDCEYGEGFFRYDNGDTFEGSFHHGRKGKGIYKWASGGFFIGNYNADGRVGTETMPSGHPIHTICCWRNKSGYYGDGEITYADGKKYVGPLSRSEPSNGFGTLFGADGEVLSEGVWKDGEIVLSGTKIRKAQQSIRELQARNDANQKIINAIKFALGGDSAKFHSSSVPREEQDYAFSDCKYITTVGLFTDQITDGASFGEYDFNKVNWATLDEFYSANEIRVECEGQCKTNKKYYVTPVETWGSHSKIYFAKEENPERSLRAINDIKDQCAGYSTPY